MGMPQIQLEEVPAEETICAADLLQLPDGGTVRLPGPGFRPGEEST